MIWFTRVLIIVLMPSNYLLCVFPVDVKRSALGLLLWVAVLTTWITIFQHFRAEWGEVGDYLSFTIPLGIPWDIFWWQLFWKYQLIHYNGPKNFLSLITVKDKGDLRIWKFMFFKCLLRHFRKFFGLKVGLLILYSRQC